MGLPTGITSMSHHAWPSSSTDNFLTPTEASELNLDLEILCSRKKEQELEVWLKWENACLVSVKL
jgi:hypothetical protein